MLRAMLVDDEPLALEGLKLLIDWPSEGFEICAECSGGGEALRRLPIDRPDLIVTDIRMAGIDGIALMQSARQAGFSGQFIVVSGYGDFEYAQRALSLGVAGYLLKPLEPQEASAVLEHVRQRLIEREACLTEQRAKLSHTVASLLAGGVAEEPALAGYRWRMATWGAPLCFDDVQQLITVFPEGSASVHIVEDQEFLVVCWPAESAEPGWEAARALLKQHRRPLLLSEPADSASRLSSLRAQLGSQLDTSCGALAERITVLTRAVALRQADECRARCAELETFCSACGADAISRARRQLVSECSRQFADDSAKLAEFLSAQDAEPEALCLLAIRLLTPKQERLSDHVIEYVQQHAEERLTLESVASALGYNSTYLGRVFRDEIGVPFRERLSTLRVERAAALLCRTDECVCTVAEQVGYSQYKRFLKHFKKRYGLTPEQYRRREAEEKRS